METPASPPTEIYARYAGYVETPGRCQSSNTGEEMDFESLFLKNMSERATAAAVEANAHLDAAEAVFKKSVLVEDKEEMKALLVQLGDAVMKVRELAHTTQEAAVQTREEAERAEAALKDVRESATKMRESATKMECSKRQIEVSKKEILEAQILSEEGARRATEAANRVEKYRDEGKAFFEKGDACLKEMLEIQNGIQWALKQGPEMNALWKAIGSKRKRVWQNE